ncbi:hypothetical protein Cgig2_010219 [Carnegiea gigantea]|uniref:Uncharacterized protein n=1 Tax=Carnegiea gigantea TaxID=171969 RepID=A0A9Q1Q6R9_9CARY|nr:hypothetical protein Cgig2_010219 [Carnegiea gigantea]
MTPQVAEYVRDNLHWSVRETSSLHPCLLPLYFTAYCPKFDHIFAMQFAHATYIPEMVQAIFYAMVINDAAKLRLIRREAEESLMLDLRKLRWDVIEAWLLFIKDKLKDAQVSTSGGDGKLCVDQVRRVANTKCTPRIRSPDELLSEGTKGNPRSALSSSKPGAEVACTGTISTSRETSCSSSDSSSRCLSSEGASTGSSSREGLPTPGKSVLNRKGRSPVGLAPKIVAEGLEFPGAPIPSDLTALEKQYLLSAGYTFIIPKADATVNELPAKCIAVYYVALNYGLRFPLHLVIEEILNKYKLVPVQVVPTSWHNICFFIATCKLRGLTYSARAFSLVHAIQRAPKETEELGCYYFNNRPGFMTAVEKKSKGNVPDWNEGKPIKNSFREPTAEERKRACYFQFYIQEDDKPRPIPKFMAQMIESMKGPEKRKSKSNDREPLNWLPKLKFFGNDFFLAAAGLLILKNFSKGIGRPNVEQVRVRLTVFETGDATSEQVTADSECCREEERQRLLNQQAKKVRRFEVI